MVEINIKDDVIQVEEFKVVRNLNYKTGNTTAVNDMRVCIILRNISLEEVNNIKSKLSEIHSPKGFSFKGSVTFNINDFYFCLYNVYLSGGGPFLEGFSYIRGIKTLTINFKPLADFEYSSGMGLGVLRELKLKEIGI